jgi:hypothetical protein
MANFGSISLPRTAVVPIAIAAARRAKLIAIVMAICAATCLLFGVADVIDGSRNARNDAASIFWVAVFGISCGFAVRRAKRMTAAAERAAADVGSTWTLAGKLIVAADDRGRPLPDDSFKITTAQRALLLSDQDQTKTVESSVSARSAT